jgi:hypothetical protein
MYLTLQLATGMVQLQLPMQCPAFASTAWMVQVKDDQLLSLAGETVKTKY